MTSFLPEDIEDQRLLYMINKCRHLEEQLGSFEESNALLQKKNHSLSEDMEELKQLTGDLCKKIDNDKK